jgi:hypothetical protein
MKFQLRCRYSTLRTHTVYTLLPVQTACQIQCPCRARSAHGLTSRALLLYVRGGGCTAWFGATTTLRVRVPTVATRGIACGCPVSRLATKDLGTWWTVRCQPLKLHLNRVVCGAQCCPRYIESHTRSLNHPAQLGCVHRGCVHPIPKPSWKPRCCPGSPCLRLAAWRPGTVMHEPTLVYEDGSDKSRQVRVRVRVCACARVCVWCERPQLLHPCPALSHPP